MEDLVEKINKSLLEILEAKTLSRLCELILKELKDITSMNTGVILLLENDKLKAISASKSLENLKIGKNDKLYTTLANGKIFFASKGKLNKFDCIKKNKEKFALIMPLAYHQEKIGIIILLADKKQNFDKKETSLLQLFSATSGIIIKKIQLHTQVQNALDTRDRFISLASHELRTPLTSLNGYVQLLHKKMANQTTIESRWVQELHEESSRLTRLIKELLDINRIRQGQLEFILQEVDMVDVIKKAIERFNFIKSEREIVFNQTLKNKKSTIIGDFNKLLQMVTALLSNAAKFSSPSSLIQINLNENGKNIQLQVIDQGRGIPKKETSKIFNGFYKIGKEEEEGMGVGLLLTEHIIRHHKGKIEINSKENKGTTIEVQLPRAAY
jgi:K+-sensing histidine kinase KdpD